MTSLGHDEVTAPVARWRRWTSAPRTVLLRLAGLLIGLAAGAALLLWSDFWSALREARTALPVLPLIAAVQLGQLFLSALAWRAMLDRAIGPAPAFRLRLVREGVDSLLPVAQVGGEILSVGLLARRGVPAALAGAGTALDLLTEAATLPVVGLAGLGVLWLLGNDVRGSAWVLGLVALSAAAAGGFALAQRLGLMRLVEAIARRLPGRLQVDGLHEALLARVRDGRAVSTATMLHVAAWSGGMFEVWIALRALGHPVGIGAAFVIESIGMLGRGVGFAVPGSLGVQEGGFIAGAALCGLGPEAALALSALKRVREIAVGALGLALWQLGRRITGRSGLAAEPYSAPPL